MKAMVSIDLATMRSFLPVTAATSLIVLAALLIGMQNITAPLAAVCAMVPLLCLVSLGTYDEYNDWGRFRLAMPLSRANVVLGRYASLLVVMAATLAAVVVVGLAVADIASLVPGDFAAKLSDCSPIVIASVAAMALTCAVVGCAVTLPLCMRFGMTNAVRFVPVFVAMLVALLLAVVGSSIDPSESVRMGVRLVQWIEASETNALIGAGCILAVGLVLYAVSAVVAIRLYASREL